MRAWYSGAGDGPCSIAATMARSAAADVDDDRSEPVTLVVEVALAGRCGPAQHVREVELEVDDRAIEVRGVEGDRRVVR